MKKRILITIFILIAILAITIPASAAWSERISGGSSYASPYGPFTVTLSAWENTDGTFGGQGQYYYPPLDRTFHLKVQKVCTGVVGGSGPYAGQPYAVGIGEVFGQDGTEVSVGYGAIAVAEGGDYGDGFRVAFDKTWDFVDTWCNNGAEYKFPARVVDGNFNLRSK